jgi:O-antigen/teichoic acid export membrane protein
MKESKSTFFKQSGWLVIATGACGAFLILVYPVLRAMPVPERGIFMSLLRVFAVLGAATVGLQIIMAQDAAAAITPESRRELGKAVRSVSHAILGLWSLMALLCIVFQNPIAAALKISNKTALWVTLGLALAQLFLPFLQGLLQGFQNFAWLGWSIILNGVGRFAGICLMVFVFKSHSSGALFGALIGLASAVLIAFWPCRKFFSATDGNFDWFAWFCRVVPLTLGMGASLVLLNADVIFVQWNFPKDIAPYYSAVAMVGVGLVTFTGPVATVMFPKLVRSVAQSQESNSLALALAGTILLGLAGAILCTLLPSVPLRILYFNQPEFWVSSQLVPWFIWAMLPVTIANVLISNLLARQRFQAVPWLAATAAGYGLSLHLYLTHADKTNHFAIFKGVILRLGLFASLLLIISAIFTFWIRDHSRRAKPM